MRPLAASCRRDASTRRRFNVDSLRSSNARLPVTMSTLMLGHALCRRSLVTTSSVLYVGQLPRRHLSCTALRLSSPSSSPTQDDASRQVSYHGPLTQTFRRLKVFSLSSLALSCIMTPFIFIIESSLPISARIALATTALTTSGVSTALVGWAGSPYVVDLRRLTPAENGGIEGIEMATLTLTLRRLTTRVYDADFLLETRRPFAKWELAEEIQLASSSEEPVTAAKAGAPGEVETVAETLNAKNEVIGRWVVKWGERGAGSCKAVGKVVR